MINSFIVIIKLKNSNKYALYQILVNLVDNALKYNYKTDRKVKINYESLNQYHRFSVEDNGIVIPRHQQERVFELFETIKNDFNKSSTIIGFNRVKSLINKLVGAIFISSEIDKGSTFSFTIKNKKSFRFGSFFYVIFE